MADEKLTDASEKVAKDLVSSSTTFKENLKEAVSYFNQLQGNVGGGQSANVGNGNQRSSAAPSTSSNPYTGMGSSGADNYTGMGDVTQPGYRGKGLQDLIGPAVDGLTGILKSAALAMPTGQEAMTTQLLGSRLKFYGGSSSLLNSQSIQYNLARYGMANDPLDSVRASVQGVSQGLLPGLSNYSNGINSGFGGTLGGAALASNLVPGLGLQGGVNAVAGLNNPRSVNMLKMMGVSVRNGSGSQMNDLPDIIKRIYDILKHANEGKELTANDIAISAMAGNALDSILNQYFSGSAEIRMTVIAGLMQMSNKGGQSLSTAGNQFQMRATGGTTVAASSIGRLNAQELNLIQSYSKPVLQGVVTANDVLFSLYKELINAGSSTGPTRVAAEGLAGLTAGLETFGAARNGAGATLLGAAFDLASPINNAIPAGMAGAAQLTALAGGALATGNYFRDNNVGSNINVYVGNASGDVSNIGWAASQAISRSMTTKASGGVGVW